MFRNIFLFTGLLLISQLLQSQTSQQWTGKWAGTLASERMNLNLMFEIEAKRSEWYSYISVPEQNISHYRLDGTEISKKNITLTWDLPNASFTGRRIDTGRIKGQWHQGGKSQEIVLHRVWGEWPKPKPQTPKPPYSWVREKVKLSVASGRIMLAGELDKPDSTGVFPVVILISGSGAQDRDGSIGMHKPFLVLTEKLTNAGFAVLRFDDRGAGQTTGHGPTLAATTSADQAADVRQMIAWLKQRTDVDINKIGLIGHSEGGIIAPMVAASDSSVAFIVLMAPPAVGGLNINIEQNRYGLEQAGYKQNDIAHYLALHRQLLIYIASLKDTSGWEKEVDRLAKKWDQEYATSKARKIAFGGKKYNAEMLHRVYGSFLSPWWHFLLSYNPSDDLKKLDIPVLALIGSKDVQVLPEENMEVIRHNIPENLRTFGVLPGLNHLFQHCNTCKLSEYTELDETLNPEFLDGLLYWLKMQK